MATDSFGLCLLVWDELIFKRKPKQWKQTQNVMSLNVNYKPDFPTVCLLVCNVYVQITTQQAR